MMILKNFLTTLRRFKTSSILNICGLALAFTASYIIIVQVNFDFRYNHCIKEVDQLFRIETRSWQQEDKYNIHINRPLAEQILRTDANVECGGTINLSSWTTMVTHYQGEKREDFALGMGRITLPILEVFGFEAVEGNLKALEDNKQVAISERTAEKFSIKMNETLWLQREECTVAAIFKDFPADCDLHDTQVIGKFDIDNYLNDYSNWNHVYYLKLKDPSQAETFVEIATKALYEQQKENDKEETDTYEKFKDNLRLRLMPVSQIHFESDTVSTEGKRANRTTTYVLLVIAVLTLLIAFINFFNFFMALVPRRIRSVNTQKVFGCAVSKLRLSFVVEAMGLVLIAQLIAVFIVKLVASTTLANFASIPIPVEQNAGMALFMLALGIALAIVSSLYPAYYITSIPPAFALKGSFGNSLSGRRMRYLLLGFQFVISLTLITCSIFIKLQHSYMMNYDMGFNKTCLVAGTVPEQVVATINTRDQFMDRLKSNPMIEEVAFGAGPIVAESRMGWGRSFKGQTLNCQCYPVTWNFLQFMGIEVTEGRNFSPSDDQRINGCFIFNECARKQYEMTLEDHLSGHNGDTDIVGFCKDFLFRPLQFGITPFAFYVYGSEPWQYPNYLYARTSPQANLSEVEEYIKTVCLEFVPNYKKEWLTYHFFDEELGAQYKKEQQLTTLVMVFSFISIAIALMGVFGLVFFETQYRRKEIAIRRVNGSTSEEILRMFTGHYLKMVLVCFVLSIPICYFILHAWLQGFSQHIALYPWVFLLSLVIVSGVTLTIVTIRCWNASHENPVKSLQKE